MSDELLYRLALSQLPGVGSVQAKILVEHFGDAQAIFKARKRELGAVAGIGEVKAAQIKAWKDFAPAEREIRFMEKHGVRPVFITDACYPKRLRHCEDAPVLLFYRGVADLNNTKVVSIIGTRSNTDYGKWITEQLIHSLQSLQVLVVSGLAFGIDAIAHKTSLQDRLPTVAVLAHGLDRIYPFQHHSLANELMICGGLLTEFPAQTKPDRFHFPRRNRIVAGMSDATIVIETAVKGGSMITADLANNYHRDVFAVPGKITDPRSAGCLQLIQQHKAVLLTTGEQLVEAMGWNEKKPVKKQLPLFTALSEDEKKIMAVLNEKEVVHIDELYQKTGLTNSAIAAAMLNLELQHTIFSLPGKLYKSG